MKLLSFLGVGDYKETTYFIDDCKIKTCYAPISIAYCTKAKELILFITDEAEKKHLERIKEEQKEKIPSTEIETVKIPAGFTEKERWIIWEKVISKVNREEEISFDLTHSYRTIPFYAFFAIQFLKHIKKIKLKGVFYGAFEVEGEEKPIININELFFISDWFYYATYFVKTGIFPEEAKKSILLPTLHKFLSKQTSQTSELLREISLNIHFIQRDSLKKSVKKFMEMTKKVEFPASSSIPFFLIFEYIKNEYYLLGDSESDDIKLLEWLFKKGHYTQTLLLLEEEIITRLSNQEKIHSWDERENVRRALNEWRKREGIIYPIVDLWKEIHTIRNDIAHCGIVKNTKDFPIDDIVERIEKLIGDYKKINNKLFREFRKILKSSYSNTYKSNEQDYKLPH